MSKLLINENWLASLGDKIREKTGTTDLISVGAMASAIESVPDSEGLYAWTRNEVVYEPGKVVENSTLKIVDESYGSYSKRVSVSDKPPVYDANLKCFKLVDYAISNEISNGSTTSAGISTKGKYLAGEDGLGINGKIYHCTTDITISYGSMYYDVIHSAVYDYYFFTDLASANVVGNFIEFVTSDNKNQYICDGSIAADGYIYKKFVSGPWAGITWADGTDEEIVAMIEAADRGEINLSDYWTVGDARAVNLSAMAATGVGESHSAQTVEFVLMHVGGYELNEATPDGRTTCSFIVGMRNCLNETGYMNSSNTNSGSWNDSARRAWCNSVFYNAIPSTLRSIFKQFKVITAKTYNGTALQTSVDYFTLPAAKEVCGGETATSAGKGTTYNSNLAEFNTLFQYDWYKTTSRRTKTVNGANHIWWERSPVYNSSGNFCLSNTYGGVASTASGISPVGCI